LVFGLLVLFVIDIVIDNCTVSGLELRVSGFYLSL